MAWSDVAQKIGRATRGLIESARVKEMEASVKALKQQPDIKGFLNRFPVAKTYDEP
jgi:5,10-methylene-tetrahydrofolate dehydrogenase/methenyl tetrahydrofolate cyclohydrolase